jgi:hypothetical protein
MKYLPVSWRSELLPKLLGCYEAELHDVIRQVARRPYDVMINIGCGEGYYAVGLARLMPSLRVHALDSNPKAQALCRQLAELNGVADRVTVGGACTPAVLKELIGRQTFILCDCEGTEASILDPEQVPGLASCDILVELHDVYDPGLSESLPARFRTTHELTFIDHAPRDWREFPGLRERKQLDQLLAVWEARPGPTPWAFLEANARADLHSLARTTVPMPGSLFDFSVLDAAPAPDGPFPAKDDA